MPKQNALECRRMMIQKIEYVIRMLELWYMGASVYISHFKNCLYDACPSSVRAVAVGLQSDADIRKIR